MSIDTDELQLLDRWWRAANIRRRDVEAIFLAGPGHGGPAAVANPGCCCCEPWLEGTYSEVYPHVGQHEAGMRRAENGRQLRGTSDPPPGTNCPVSGTARAARIGGKKRIEGMRPCGSIMTSAGVRGSRCPWE